MEPPLSDNGDHAPDPLGRGDGSDPERPPGPRAAYAVNWRVVLFVDALMGMVVVVGGLIAVVIWNFWLGALLMLAGCVYVAMVGRRADQWRRLRRDRGPLTRVDHPGRAVNPSRERPATRRCCSTPELGVVSPVIVAKGAGVVVEDRAVSEWSRTWPQLIATSASAIAIAVVETNDRPVRVLETSRLGRTALMAPPPRAHRPTS